MMRITYHCFSGWQTLIEDTASQLQQQSMIDHVLTDEADLDICCDDKLGRLRINVTPCSDNMKRIMEKAEARSKQICELCGAPGLLQQINGWFVVRCENCLNRRNVDKLYKTLSSILEAEDIIVYACYWTDNTWQDKPSFFIVPFAFHGERERCVAYFHESGTLASIDAMYGDDPPSTPHAPWDDKTIQNFCSFDYRLHEVTCELNKKGE